MLDLLNTLFRTLAPLWEMSVTATYVAAVVIVLRLLLKRRAPKQVLCLLWLVVFARLLIPISLESPLSIVPDSLPGQEQQGQSTGQIPVNPPEAEAPVAPAAPQVPVQNPAQGQTSAQNPGAVAPVTSNPGVPTLTTPEDMTPAVSQPETPAPFPWQAVLAGAWLTGAAAMALYGLVSYLRLRRRLFDAIRAKDGAWEHPAVASPFILGLFRPRVYLPAGLSGQPRQFILCHERAHLRRRDHIVKPVCWAALALHWFNPMVWLAFLLMSRDMEAACDEAVLRRLGDGVKADYSATLLSLATNGRVPAPCPLAFDEGNAKGRIKNVLNYRRPALWIVVVSVIAAVLAAACLLTDPVAAGEDPDPSPDPDVTDAPSQPPVNLAGTVLDPWMEEVLDGERTFRDAYREHNYGDSQDYTIHQLRSYFYGDEELPKVTVELGQLTVMDLDKDGINELVIWPTGEHDDPTEVGYYTGYLVLRREGDQVYGHNPGWRTMGDLKADGTFDWSGSAFEWGTGSARFTEDGFEIQRITWCDNSVDAEHYFVDGLAAEKKEFERAIYLRQYQPDPIWYTYTDGVLTRLPPSIPLDEFTLSVPAPHFLDAEQLLLYRQAFQLCDTLFGIVNDSTHFYPGPEDLEPAEEVERNGISYTPEYGRFARWDDFERTMLSVFTRDFWDGKNYSEKFSEDSSVPVYINVDGRTYYIPYGRSGGNYNGYFPETFRLVGQTDDTLSFIMTAYYSYYYPLEGETEEEANARVAACWDYSIDFPMRMVKTENGWRFDEFYLAHVDDGEFYSQRVSNPNPFSQSLALFDIDTGGKMGTLLVTVTLGGKNPASDWGCFSAAVSVYDPQDMTRPIQTIDAEMQMLYTPNIIDANFDGHLDFGLLHHSGNQPRYWCYWLWNEAAGQFVEEPAFLDISDPSFDPETNTITGWARSSGAGDGLTTFHRWEDGRLVCARRINVWYDPSDAVVTDEELTVNVYQMTVEDRIGGELTQVYYKKFSPGEDFFPERTKWEDLNYYGGDSSPDPVTQLNAPLDSPLVTNSNQVPADPAQWYKVAELPDDLIWVFSRNYGQETLLRFDGNLWRTYDHVAHTPHCNMPRLKKLGDADHLGPLAVISEVNTGTGVGVEELVVYSDDMEDYTHDWTALAEDFNQNHSFRFDNDTRVMTLTYRGQTVTKTFTDTDVLIGDHDRIEQEGCSLFITGEMVHYSFDENADGDFQLRLGAKFLIGDSWAISLFPVDVTWTLRFTGSGFDVIPGSCKVT